MSFGGKFLNLFHSKPASLGEGLKRVKKAFHAIGDDIANIPGQRLYNTPGRNEVAINSANSKLSISHKFRGQYASADHKNSLAKVDRDYFNYTIGESKVKLCRDTKRSFYTGEIDAFCKSEVKTFYDKSKTRIIPYEKAASMGLRV